MVIAPANTGNVVSNKIAVINTVQTNNGSLCIYIPRARIFKIVVIKLTAPKIDPAPARCKLKIAISTAPPECDNALLNGG